LPPAYYYCHTHWLLTPPLAIDAAIADALADVCCPCCQLLPPLFSAMIDIDVIDNSFDAIGLLVITIATIASQLLGHTLYY